MIDCGVAEANMVGVASGLSVTGFIPFAATFGCFAARRVFDQFFLSANYAKLNVNLYGTDPGVAAAYNGGTHMPFEDIGLMRMIPDLVITEPSDAVSAAAFTELNYKTKGSTYTRLHRKAMPAIYNENENFEIGKGKVLVEGADITIFSLGAVMTQEALKAAKILKEKNINASIVDVLTIKPIDKELILEYAKKTGKVITCENHQVSGGLGCIVSMLLFENQVPAKMKMIGVHDEFGQVGTTEWLLGYYKMTAGDIVNAAEELM
jgi:transketolase